VAFVEFENVFFVFLGVGVIGMFLLFYFFKLRKFKYDSKKISTNPILARVVKKRTQKERIISILFLVSVFCLFVALSEPMMRLKGTNEGVNVVLVVDSSGSMGAQDFSPSRMEAIKSSAVGLVEQLEIKDRIGVIGFSDTTRIVSFLTNDKDRVKEKISTIREKGATAIGDGLAMGVDMVTSIPNKKKLVILLSDGEQNAGQINIDDAILYAKSEDVVVYTIGMGNPDEQVVLGYDWFGRPQYATLDEDSLIKIAQNTNGEYFRATDTVKLDEIYEDLPDKFKKEKELQSVKDWFIWFAVFCLMLIFVVKYWRGKKLW